MRALMPGKFSPALLCGCGPLDMGAEPTSGLVSLGVGATMRIWEQLLALGLGCEFDSGSQNPGLNLLLNCCANPKGQEERVLAGFQCG